MYCHILIASMMLCVSVSKAFDYTVNSGSGSGMRNIEARINWNNRSNETNTDNNRMILYIDIGEVD